MTDRSGQLATRSSPLGLIVHSPEIRSTVSYTKLITAGNHTYNKPLRIGNHRRGPQRRPVPLRTAPGARELRQVDIELWLSETPSGETAGRI